jgi:hypothetical protein
LTWNNAPPIGTETLADIPAVATGTWIDLPLAAGYVSGAGTVRIGIDSPAGDSVLYSSREGGFPAQLVVTTVTP